MTGKRRFFRLSAVAVVLMASTAHASEPSRSARSEATSNRFT